MDEITVELDGVTKRFDDLVAVDNLSLQIKKGEFFSLLGPSGCGKTTTLRMIAGFLEPDDGRILINGQDMAYFPPNKRDIGMVYQNYALFPHMTVSENVAFGLRMRRVDRKEGWIAGFASDVWWDYPDAMPPSYFYPVPSRLGIHRMPNVIASGDRSGNVLSLKNRVLEMGAESVGAFIRGETPPRLIDLELGY